MTQDIKVRPIIPICISIIMWLFGWACLIFNPNPVFHQHIVFNLALERIYDLFKFATVAFLGPYGLFYYSWTLEVSNNRFKLSKIFGIIKHEYSYSNIKTQTLIPHQKNRGPSTIKIVFDDGVSVKIDSFSSNFKLLWSYLQKA